MQKSRVDTVFVLLIFCVFATSVFLVIMLSGSTYQRMNEITADGQNERIVLSYIRTKIRNADVDGAVVVSDYNGVSALSISEHIEDRVFITYIYFYDGWVYELFHEQGSSFALDEAVPILQVGSLEFTQIEDNLIQVTTNKGIMLIHPRSTLGGAAE